MANSGLHTCNADPERFAIDVRIRHDRTRRCRRAFDFYGERLRCDVVRICLLYTSDAADD